MFADWRKNASPATSIKSIRLLRVKSEAEAIFEMTSDLLASALCLLLHIDHRRMPRSVSERTMT